MFGLHIFILPLSLLRFFLVIRLGLRDELYTPPTVNLCLPVFTPIKMMMIFVKMYLTQFIVCDNQL
jgi:hypothetical protein